MKQFCVLIVIVGMILLAGYHARAELLGDYVGVTSCIACHDEIVAGWETTPHANAFATLKRQGEEKQAIPGCFKCHVTGFGMDGGYIDAVMTPELANVQCEACHGPGRKHVETDGDPGEIIAARPGIGNCRICHTEGQDKNFDYDVKRRYVHGGKPPAIIAREGPSKSEGRLRADARFIDFGNMVEGVVATRTIKLKNTDSMPLKISNVSTS